MTAVEHVSGSHVSRPARLDRRRPLFVRLPHRVPVIAARHVTISLTLVLESHGSRSSDGGELLSL